MHTDNNKANMNHTTVDPNRDTRVAVDNPPLQEENTGERSDTLAPLQDRAPAVHVVLVDHGDLQDPTDHIILNHMDVHADRLDLKVDLIRLPTHIRLITNVRIQKEKMGKS